MTHGWKCLRAAALSLDIQEQISREPRRDTWCIFLYWHERMKRRKLKRTMQQLKRVSSEAGNKTLTMCFRCHCIDTGPGNRSNELSPGDGITTKREEMSFSTCIKTRHASVKEDVPRAQKCTGNRCIPVSHHRGYSRK